MFNVQEDYYFQEKSPQNYLQADFEQRRCRTCNKITTHAKQIILPKLPKILAVRIGDGPDYDLTENNTSPHLYLRLGPQGTLFLEEFNHYEKVKKGVLSFWQGFIMQAEAMMGFIPWHMSRAVKDLSDALMIHMWIQLVRNKLEDIQSCCFMWKIHQEIVLKKIILIFLIN